jgi:hypothetical protein
MLQENIDSNNQFNLDGEGDINSVYGDYMDTNFLNAGGFLKKIKKIATSKVGKIAAGIATGGASVAASKKQRQQLTKDVKTAAKTKVGKAIINVSTGGLGTKEGRANLKKVGKVIKTLSLAPMRNSVELLIRLNIWGLASDLKKKKDAATKSQADLDAWEKVRKVWYKVGGNRTTFDKMVEAGSKKKALKISFGKKSGADGSYYYEALGQNEDGEWYSVAPAVAAIVAAAPIIAAIINAMGKKPAAIDPESSANLDSEYAATNDQMTDATKALESSGELEKVAAAEAAGEEYEAAEIDPATGKIIKTAKQKIAGGLPMWAKVAIGVGGVALLTTIIVVVAKN